MKDNKKQVLSKDYIANKLSNSDKDKLYNLLFLNALKESEEDIKSGRVMTIEESKERMRKKYANFNVK